MDVLIPFEELKKHNFMLSDIHAIFHVPKAEQWKVQNRSKTALLYVLTGKCINTSSAGIISAEEGALLYLPKGSSYSFTVTEEPVRWCVVDFNLSINEESALFAQFPLKLADFTSVDCREAVFKLAENYYSEDNTLAKTCMLCTILLSVQHIQYSRRSNQIAPAIRSMREQIMQDPIVSRFCAARLAALCNLSTAQFYYLFREEYGMTPLEYHNKLLLHKAEVLLDTQQYTVAEVSAMIGFDNPAYFSRFFKKHKGMPPSERLVK